MNPDRLFLWLLFLGSGATLLAFLLWVISGLKEWWRERHTRLDLMRKLDLTDVKPPKPRYRGVPEKRRVA